MAILALIVASLVALGLAVVALPLGVLVAVGRRLGALVQRWWGRGPVPEVAPDRLDTPVPLIIAIHGTWAPANETPWVQRGSPLHTALASRLRLDTGTEPAWHTFSWSGDNSAKGRGDAVLRLTALVHAACASAPERPVVLIGHSHGGNIAARVAQELIHLPQIRVVTLATPFLTVVERPDTRLLQRVLPLVNLLALPVAAALIARFGLRLSDARVALVTMAVLAASAWLTVDMFWRARHTLAVLRAASLDPTELDALRPRTFIVSRIGDEADAGIKLMALATTWVVRTLQRSELVGSLGSVASRAERDVAASGTPFTASGLRSSSWLFLRSRSVAVQEIVAMLLGLLLLSLLQMLAGTASALTSVAVNVASSETPPGEWRHLQSTWSGEPGASLLSHSQVYDDAAVIRAVADWVATAS